jgi:hypothetical protein
VKKPQRSRKSGRPTHTVSTDKHQGPKKGPSARQEQRKASSGERQKRPTTRTTNFFLERENGSGSDYPDRSTGTQPDGWRRQRPGRLAGGIGGWRVKDGRTGGRAAEEGPGPGGSGRAEAGRGREGLDAADRADSRGGWRPSWKTRPRTGAGGRGRGRGRGPAAEDGCQAKDAAEDGGRRPSWKMHGRNRRRRGFAAESIRGRKFGSESSTSCACGREKKPML